MRIGLLNESFPPIEDGVGQVVLNTGRLLQQRGHDVTVVTAKVPGYDYDTLYDFRVVGVPSLPVPLKQGYRMEMPANMILPMQKVMKIPFDIVHAHSPATSGHLAYRLSKKYDIPFVITFHTKFRDDLKLAVSSDSVVDMMVRQVMRIYDKADEVWVPQASVLDVMREYGYKGDAYVMPNATEYAIDPALVPQRRKEARQHLLDNVGTKVDHVLLFVGQIIWEKNIRFILEALEKLPADCNYHAFFVGKGYALEDFTKLVEAKQMRDKVTLVGQVNDRSVMEDYYFAADLFLFPSIYDNAPLVVREAAAHHLPAILMRGSTSAEIVEENVNGILTDNDPDQLMHLILDALADKNRLHLIGEEAARTIGRTWKELVPEVEARYQYLIEKKAKH